MTDNFNYQDVFKTINIPKSERRIALKAKNLFDIANGAEQWDPSVYLHLDHITNGSEAAQAFWKFENEETRAQDVLALTIMRNGLTMAIQHRDIENVNNSVRASLFIANGVSTVFSSDIRGRGVSDMGSSAELIVEDFKENFLKTTANLGLYNHIRRLETDQNESNSAIFASAA